MEYVAVYFMTAEKPNRCQDFIDHQKNVICFDSRLNGVKMLDDNSVSIR